MNRILTFVLALTATGGTARATLYDFVSQFSDANNPNGTWSYRQGNAFLPHTAGDPGNALTAATANGYWGTNNQFASAVIRTTANGSTAAGYDNNDFLAGDVIAHSTNPGGGDPVRIAWTAPGAGSIVYDGSVWYAHSPVARGNDFALRLNAGAPLEGGFVTTLQDRALPVTFGNAGEGLLNVAAGDVLALELTPSAGQSFGSLSGVDLSVDFTPVPEPGSLGLAAAAAAGLLLVRRRRTA